MSDDALPHDQGRDTEDHGHSHSALEDGLVSHQAAVRAIWVSVDGLALTAILQLRGWASPTSPRPSTARAG